MGKCPVDFVPNGIRLNLYRPNVLLNVHNLELDSYNWIYQKPLTASSFRKYFAWYMFSMTFSTVFSGKCSRCMTMYRSLKSIQIRIVDPLFTTLMLFTHFVGSNWCSMTSSYSILQSSIFQRELTLWVVVLSWCEGGFKSNRILSR